MMVTLRLERLKSKKAIYSVLNILTGDLTCIFCLFFLSIWQSPDHCHSSGRVCGTGRIRMLYLLLLLPQEEAKRV